MLQRLPSSQSRKELDELACSLASGDRGWGVKVGTLHVITSHCSHLDVVEYPVDRAAPAWIPAAAHFNDEHRGLQLLWAALAADHLGRGAEPAVPGVLVNHKNHSQNGCSYTW